MAFSRKICVTTIVKCFKFHLIGHAMSSSGDCDGAIKYLTSAVEMMRKLKLEGQTKEKLATALYNLGLAYETYPDNQKALQVHTRFVVDNTS